VLHHNSVVGESAQQEKEADAFASEFLIPQAALKAYLPKLPNLTEIFEFKTTYEVSAWATVVSLHRADFLIMSLARTTLSSNLAKTWHTSLAYRRT